MLVVTILIGRLVHFFCFAIFNVVNITDNIKCKQLFNIKNNKGRPSGSAG